MGGLAQDEGDRDCSLASLLSHIMEDDHSSIFCNNTVGKELV